MRILSLNKFYWAAGGADRIMLDIERQLARRGHETASFAMVHDKNEPSPYSSYFAARTEYRQGGVAAVRGALRSIHNQSAAKQLEALVRRFRPHVAHAHNVYHQLSPSVLRVLSRYRIPVVLHLHDYKLACPVYTLLRNGRPCLECVGREFPVGAAVHNCHPMGRMASTVVSAESTIHRITRSYDRHVSHYVASSYFMQSIMVGHGLVPESVTVIPNGLPDFPEVVVEQGLDQRPAFLYAGRLSYEKGLELLMRVAHRLPHVDFFVAGDGPMAKDISVRARLLPNVQQLGRLSPRELALQRARTWASLVPSQWFENAPMTILESYAAGRMVLGSRHGGIPEMIMDERTGFLVSPYSLDDWVGAIGKVAGNRELAVRMGGEARKWAVDRFDLTTLISQYESLYDALVQRRALP